jgi:hypothetical protein
MQISDFSVTSNRLTVHVNNMQLTKVTNNAITCFRIEYNVIKIMCFVITIKKMFIPNTFIFLNIYYNRIHLIGCMHACDMLFVYVILCEYL